MPSNQFERPSELMELAMNTDTITANNSRGFEIQIHWLTCKPAYQKLKPERQNIAICKLDPTATDTERSILSFNATLTAVACSAALPIIW